MIHVHAAITQGLLVTGSWHLVTRFAAIIAAAHPRSAAAKTDWLPDAAANTSQAILSGTPISLSDNANWLIVVVTSATIATTVTCRTCFLAISYQPPTIDSLQLETQIAEIAQNPLSQLPQFRNTRNLS